MKLAEYHLVDMENSNERINRDLRDAYQSYKLGMTDKETYLDTSSYLSACRII